MNRLMKQIVMSISLICLVAICYLFFGNSGNREATQCLFFDFYDFNQQGNLYYRDDIPKVTITSLQDNMSSAVERVYGFLGDTTAIPKIIYLHHKKDRDYFLSNPYSPALTKDKFCTCIFITPEGNNVDVIAHEMVHAEIYDRLGFMKSMDLPIWFHEGLAMQVDYRFGHDNPWSKQKLVARLNALQNMETMQSLVFEYNGRNTNSVAKNYQFAKEFIRVWYTKEKLNTFITNITQGVHFNTAFGSINKLLDL